MDRPAGDISMPDDVRAIIDGDPAATHHFVRMHMPWMLVVARRILNEANLAEDAVQTAFAKIFQALSKFEGRSSIKTWMRRIVINEALMLVRKRKQQSEEPIEEYLPTFDQNGCRTEEIWSSAQTPESALHKAQTQKTIFAKINQLPGQYRTILILRDIEELSTQETAEATGLSEANVRVRLHRARAALKKLLEPFVRNELL